LAKYNGNKFQRDANVTRTCSWCNIPTANLWLRSADRVRLKLGEFTAITFDERFEGTKALP